MKVLLLHVWVSCGWCNKLSQTWWLKTTQMYSFTILQVRSLKWVSLGENQGTIAWAAFFSGGSKTDFLVLSIFYKCCLPSLAPGPSHVQSQQVCLNLSAPCTTFKDTAPSHITQEMLALLWDQLINHLNYVRNLNLQPPPAHCSQLISFSSPSFFLLQHWMLSPLGSALAVPFVQMLLCSMHTWLFSHLLTSPLKYHHLREVSLGHPAGNCTLFTPDPSPLFLIPIAGQPPICWIWLLTASPWERELGGVCWGNLLCFSHNISLGLWLPWQIVGIQWTYALEWIYCPHCEVWAPNLWCVCVCAQSCSTLCDPVDCNPPGSSVHGIFQARILEWVTTSSSRKSSRLRD